MTTSLGESTHASVAAKSIDLRLLRYFAVVAETEHVGRAAARLHISQSPLSRQIRQLEELLGVTLFKRQGRRIKLTDAGRWLLGPARDMLARSELLVREAREHASGEAGRIAIGFVGAALATGILPAALRALREQRPRVRIELKQLASQAQLAAVRSGELDLALVHGIGHGIGADLDEDVLLEQPYVLAVPKPGPLVRGTVRAAALKGLPWIAVVAGDASRERWAATWAKAGFAPNLVVEVADWTSALALVDAGVGHALVPASYAKTPPAHVAIRPLPWLKIASRLSLVRRRGAASTVARDVIKWLSAAAKRTTPKLTKTRRRRVAGP